VLEALSCGVPVVAFRTGGIPELIDHMETGYLAKYRDVDDMTKGLIAFIDNPSLINRASRNALVSSTKYSFERMADEYIKLYTEFFVSK
ncbi:MAG: glycosyltransferase family 4 protein, partial [Firmicutes bacterium]|nr:glycosyltransferase family 4 protein [Bacillota bacterium]